MPGRMANVKNTMPMPPSQWLMLRQNSREWVRPSTSAKAVEPVVVKPLMASKKATDGRSVAPLMRKGIMPTMENTAHVSDTTR